jgi:hypothetical protein
VNKKRKFASFEEAKAYCAERGELEFFGRAGVNYEYCVYNVIIGMRVYSVYIHDSGLLEILRWRYKQ